jgi:hypothetical protein
MNKTLVELVSNAKFLCASLPSLPPEGAVANKVVWRLMSTEAWVNFKTFGLTAALFLFFMTQGKLLETYGIEEDEAKR